MHLQINKDHLSLDVTGGLLTLGFNNQSVNIYANEPTNLDIVDSNVYLTIGGKSYSLGDSLEGVSFNPSSLKEKDVLLNNNNMRYTFSKSKSHPLTLRVLQTCLNQKLSKEEIFRNILPKEEHKYFLSLGKYRRSYDYYRPLIWSLVEGGLIKSDTSDDRQSKYHKFQTTSKGILLLSGFKVSN